jgi:hypothetical protein
VWMEHYIAFTVLNSSTVFQGVSCLPACPWSFQIVSYAIFKKNYCSYLMSVCYLTPTFPSHLTCRHVSSSFSRAALWVGTTSFMILVLPVVFETERLQLEQQQLQQQRQVLYYLTDRPSSIPNTLLAPTTMS